MLIEWNGGNRPPRMIIAVDSTITLYTADGEPLVTIRPDGSLHYHTGYTPDEAARAFWEAVSRLYPGFMAKQGGA